MHRKGDPLQVSPGATTLPQQRSFMATSWKTPSPGASERCLEAKLTLKEEFSSHAVPTCLGLLGCGCGPAEVFGGLCGEEVGLGRHPSCSPNLKNRNLTSLLTKYQLLSRLQLSYSVGSENLVGGRKKKMSEVFKHVGPCMHPSMASRVFFSFFLIVSHSLPSLSLLSLSFFFNQSIFIKLLSWKDL